MIDEELQSRASAYALGALEPAEATSFEALLASRPDLQALVRDLREVSAIMATAATDAAPAPGLRDRVLAAARAQSPAAREAAVVELATRRRLLPAGLAWAAAIIGLVATVGQTVRVQRRDAVVRQVAAALDTVSRRRDVLEERLAAILDGRTSMYLMRPTGQSGPVYGAQVFWRQDQQTWLVHAFDMPRLAAGSVYQLWYVTADAKISAGVFEVDEEGHGVKVLHVPAEARGATLAAMSIEPGPAGSAQPTGPIVLAGSVKSDRTEER